MSSRKYLIGLAYEFIPEYISLLFGKYYIEAKM